MGDAPDAGVFGLLIPGVLCPVYFLLKLALSRTFFARVEILSVRLILTASVIESLAPSISLFVGGALASSAFPDERLVRIAAFMIVLLVVNCIVNYGVFGFRRDRPHWWIVMSFSVPATVLFPAIWVSLGKLLLILG